MDAAVHILGLEPVGAGSKRVDFFPQAMLLEILCFPLGTGF